MPLCQHDNERCVHTHTHTHTLILKVETFLLVVSQRILLNVLRSRPQRIPGVVAMMVAALEEEEEEEREEKGEGVCVLKWRNIYFFAI